MGICRPRTFPFIIFDFIIEGILILFEILMLVYLSSGNFRTTGVTIGSQAVGFIASNLSLIIAIILNLVAYYRIFMCFYELYKHLKEGPIDEK